MFDRIVLVTKLTRLQELLARHHSRSRVAFFLESRGGSIDEFAVEDDRYTGALRTLDRALQRAELPIARIERAHVSHFDFRAKDLVVALGPDGLFVNVAKYLSGQPVLTVNPDPERIDGVLMRHAPEAVARVLPKILLGQFTTESITLAQATTNDGQTLLAVNEFLVGRRDQGSSRYRLTLKGQEERQSSSGILVSTGTGSTGWMKSVMAGASALTGSLPRYTVPFPRDNKQLLFAVREPWESQWTGVSLTHGHVRYREELTIHSEMSEGGAISSDGVLEDAIDFNAGTSVTIRVADQSAQLITTLL
ncbi:NAD(+)/NADH kinase [Candidatus Uhrbacteria bacterium]|nr:NAD(+)/NADH kinase [Candidatus Uhrbacteria bacterium]